MRVRVSLGVTQRAGHSAQTSAHIVPPQRRRGFSRIRSEVCIGCDLKDAMNSSPTLQGIRINPGDLVRIAAAVAKAESSKLHKWPVRCQVIRAKIETSEKAANRASRWCTRERNR